MAWLNEEGELSWSESSPPVKVPDGDRQKPPDAKPRTPGPPIPVRSESSRGRVGRLVFYGVVAAIAVGGLVWLSLSGL